MHDTQRWADFSEALSFVGNSLLEPMNQTGAIGLDPAFWSDFPCFGDDQVISAVAEMKRHALKSRTFAEKGEDPVRRASVDFTQLFVGPPRPLAAPWETMHRPGSEGSLAGFGQATFEMNALLREAGLQVSNKNNQYSDHIGIELLFAAALCAHIAKIDDMDRPGTILQLEDFLQKHPLSWIGRLREAVQSTHGDSYMAKLLVLAESLLKAI